ncbi:MAG: hypothetical protein PHI97_19375 [Desulfobulbus sp.]|nr:hypothetical protein [Desulfobulbus sp.]
MTKAAQLPTEPQIVSSPQYTGYPSCGGLLTGGGVETQPTRYGNNTVYTFFDCHSRFAMVPTVSFVLFDITNDQ